jgi:hypothetical protein
MGFSPPPISSPLIKIVFKPKNPPFLIKTKTISQKGFD